VLTLFASYLTVTHYASAASTRYSPAALLQPGDITNAMLRNSAVTNAKVSADAAIDGSKINLGGAGGELGFASSTNIATTTKLKWATSTDTLTVTGSISASATTTFNGVAYKFPSADGSNSQLLKTNGAGQLSWGTGSAFAYTVGSTSIASATSQDSTQATSPTKLKEIKISGSGGGQVDVQFDAKVQSGYTTSARIYINGIAVGTTRTTTSTGDVTFNEYITVAANDLVQLYCWGNDAGFRDYYCNDMYIKASIVEVTTVIDS